MLQNNSKEQEPFIDESITTKTEETIIILSLVEEISKLEEKIKTLKNSITNEIKKDEKNIEIENLKKEKNKLTKEMNDLSVNLLLNTSNKENLIKKKSYLIKDLNKKINNYKNILSTYNILAFNSPILKKYINSNKINSFLSDEQIDDIMSKTQTIYNNENLIQKYEKEYMVNKEELNNIENDRKKILQKINEIKENLKMMKEEKITIKNELVNYISLKETLESIIKVNLPSLLNINKEEENNEYENKNDSKNYEKNSFISNKEANSQNRGNTINSITEEENENNNNIIENQDISYFNLNNNNIIIPSIIKKSWDEIINLYKYELFYLESNKISTGISNDIFDTISTKIINENNNNNNNPINNLGNSIVLESKKTSNISTNILGKAKLSAFNNRYSQKSSMIFSCESPIIKKTKTNIFLFNDINDCKKEIQIELKNEIQKFIHNMTNNNKISIKNFIEKISDMLINKLNEYGHILNKKNLMIYLSCYFKKNFYECMIAQKLKFTNKDYKNIKKNKKKKIENLQDQLTKLNTRYETIKNTIILQENKIKLLNKIENQDNKKIKENNDINNIGNLKLTLDEQNYIQLCRKANSFINEKNEIEREIEENKNDIKLSKYQGELKINSIKNEINDINERITSLQNDSFNKKVKADEEISKNRKIIMEKYTKIKEYLNKYKKKCLNNDISIYNKFIDNIINNIDNKYYKSLLDLEKYKPNNYSPNEGKYKNKEIKTTINNFSYLDNNDNDNDNEKDNCNQTCRNCNYKTHRRITSDIIRPFTLGEDQFSQISNTKNENNTLSKEKDDKIMNEINTTTKKKNNIYNENKNRVKNNNYINVFDSCNNLNNYYFQFQSPSTVISIDDNKKLNNYFVTNTNKPKNAINIISYSSPFSTNSKLHNTDKKYFSPRDVKSQIIINNLKYSISEKKPIKSEIKTKNTNKEEFKLNSNNIKSLFTSKQKTKKNKLINNLLYSFSKKDTNYTIIEKKTNPINYILNRTFCYFRILTLNDSNKKYNPLENISITELCKPPYNFIKSTLQFDKKEDTLKIFPSVQLDCIKIKTEKIESSYISSEMNIAIDIYLGFKKFKNVYKIEDNKHFIKEIKKRNINYTHLKDDEIKKYCKNKYFVFSISIKNKKKVEFLFCSYEEFKLWNNAICFFINNNNQFLINLTNRNKFEYP